MRENERPVQYPVMLQLKDATCLVVGGGQVAERKIRGLIDAQAQVIVISPTFTTGIAALVEQKLITAIQREYRSADMTADVRLAFAATSSPSLNEQVKEDAISQRVLVNVAHAAELSTFVNMSTMQRGRLMIGVSTSGASPEMAKAIASELKAQYDEAYELYVELLHQVRMTVQQQVADRAVRRYLMKQMLHMPWLAELREGIVHLDTFDVQGWVEEQRQTYMQEMIE